MSALRALLLSVLTFARDGNLRRYCMLAAIDHSAVIAT